MLPKENDWLLSHPEIETKYAGKYVAIVGESIAAYGKDFKEVLKKAEKSGNELFIHKVPALDKDLVYTVR